MWKYKHSIITEAKPALIWTFYHDISNWKKWDKEILDATLDGPFKKGITGHLTLIGQEPMLFKLTEVKENEYFSNSSVLEHAGIQIDFHHRIEPAHSKSKVTHEVVISGPNAQLLGEKIGPLITKSIPTSLANLDLLANGGIE